MLKRNVTEIVLTYNEQCFITKLFGDTIGTFLNIFGALFIILFIFK